MMASGRAVKNIPALILSSIVFAIVLETVESGRRYERSEGTLDVTEWGLFTSSYPSFHYDNWLISVKNHRILLRFSFISVESCKNCTCDYVAIYDGPSSTSPLLGKFCGNHLPPRITSTKENVLVVFKTDKDVNKRGFIIKYKSEPTWKAFISENTKKKLTEFFLKEKHRQTFTINKWGTDVTRAAVALFLRDPKFFAARNNTGEEIAYELTLQLMSKLVMKKKISTKDLALFVNAMKIACINPKEFFGLDIVAELRRRVDSSNHTNPFFILTLCNGGDNMTSGDIEKLEQLFDSYLRPSWTGTQAMVVMALKCISQKARINLSTTLSNMTTVLKRKQQNNGTVENMMTTALVIQAILENGIDYYSDFNMTLAIKSILKDMEENPYDTEEIYYILPIINYGTLVGINSRHCTRFIQTDLETMKSITHEQPTDKNIDVQISVIVGDDKDFSRNWKIKVPPTFTLYQVMENISSSDPKYKVRYTIIEGKPYITRLANFRESIEDGLFWYICSKQLSSTDRLVLRRKSPVDILINEKDEFILWYRSEWPRTLDGVQST